MDFAKGFDEVPHLRRLYKLESEDNLLTGYQIEPKQL